MANIMSVVNNTTASRPVAFVCVEESRLNALLAESRSKTEVLNRQHEQIILDAITKREMEEENKKLSLALKGKEEAYKELQRVGISNFVEFQKVRDELDEANGSVCELKGIIENLQKDESEKVQFWRARKNQQLQCRVAYLETQQREQLAFSQGMAEKLKDAEKQISSLSNENSQLLKDIQDIHVAKEQEVEVLKAKIGELEKEKVVVFEKKDNLEDQLKQAKDNRVATRKRNVPTEKLTMVLRKRAAK